MIYGSYGDFRNGKTWLHIHRSIGNILLLTDLEHFNFESPVWNIPLPSQSIVEFQGLWLVRLGQVRVMIRQRRHK